MKLLVAVVVLVLCAVLPVGGDIYTWIDGNGVKHYSSGPPPGAKEVKRQAEIKHSSDQYDKWEEQRKSRQTQILEESRSSDDTPKKNTRAVRRATKQPDTVVMYSTPTCGYCARARSFFASHDISYTDYDITTDSQARERYKKLNGSGVPLIFVGDKRIPGFNEGLLRRLLGIR